MRIKDVTDALEEFAPLALQESYDNCGLLIGYYGTEVAKVLFTLDLTDEVLDEALANKCNLIVCHHPVIFHGLKKLSGNDPVRQLVVKAIKNDVAVYAMHTNLDNSLHGLNELICEKVGLVRCSVLSPAKGMLSKLVTFCPGGFAEKVRNALFAAGGGHIGNYDCCSFNVSGMGSFRALGKADPFVGEKNLLHFENEVRIEVIFPSFLEERLVDALQENHPYEEVAYDVYSLSNSFRDAGSGMTGELETAMDAYEFLDRVKKMVNIPVLRHSNPAGKLIKKVAVCTGAGGFLTEDAMKQDADAFLTSDLKYHDYFKVSGKMILVDIGHYESERFAKELMADILIRKFPNFAFLISERNTNPINYF